MEDRVLLAGDSLATASAMSLNGQVAEAIGTPGEVDFFKVTLNESGRLTVRTRTALPAILDTRTGLLGPEGQPLIQSDGRSASDPDDLIIQHLLAGTYYLNVEGLNGRTDWYTLTHGPTTFPSCSAWETGCSNRTRPASGREKRTRRVWRRAISTATVTSTW